MRFMATPGNAPVKGEYCILVDPRGDGESASSRNQSDIIEVLRRSLELYRPGFRFRGYIDNLSGGGNAGCPNILVPDVTGMAIDALLHHFQDERLIFVPIPLDVEASYIGLVQSLSEQLCVRDGRVVADEAAFGLYLSRIGASPTADGGRADALRRKLKSLAASIIGRWSGTVPAGGSLQDDGTATYKVVLQQLDDEPSRAALKRVVEGLTEDIAAHHLQACFRVHQYLDTVRLRPGDIVISGGVFHGEEIPGMTFLLGGRGKMYCFDPAGSSDLLPHIRRWADHFPACLEFVECALAEASGTLYLRRRSDGQFDAGWAGLTASIPMRATSIDAFVRERRLASVDLIKLDIEGGEEAALRGATQTLRELRPQLAISIYHRPTSYVEIPAWLMRQCRDYRWQVKHYSFSGREVVLYGFPRERLPAASPDG